MDQTKGELIAKEFSADKVHLTDAEQRRLAAMIDADHCPDCKDDANKYPDGECQHGFCW